MTLQIIPLAATPSQTVTVTIGDQRIRLNAYQKRQGFFVDVFVNDALIIGGVLAHNLNLLIRSAYLGFIGDLFFNDTQGASDPDYSGLGSRYFLLYTDA